MGLRGSWAPFGRVLGRDLEPLGVFWDLFFPCLHLDWSSKVLLEASGLDFCMIFKGLKQILGGFGGVLGRYFRMVWVILVNDLVVFG